jgi:hypothetical protein
MGGDAVKSGISFAKFQRSVLTPSSGSKSEPSKQDEARRKKSAQFCLLLVVVVCPGYSTILKMVAARFSETSENFCQTTQHLLPEDRTLPYDV